MKRKENLVSEIRVCSVFGASPWHAPFMLTKKVKNDIKIVFERFLDLKLKDDIIRNGD